MTDRSKYQPPYTVTSAIVKRAAEISEAVGRLSVLPDDTKALRLRRINRIRTIRGSLAIDGEMSRNQLGSIGKSTPPGTTLEAWKGLDKTCLRFVRGESSDGWVHSGSC